MPLAKYLGNATPQDNTEIITLSPDEDGTPREILRGGDPVDLSGEEIRSIAANYQLEIADDEGNFASDKVEDDGDDPDTPAPAAASGPSAAQVPSGPSVPTPKSPTTTSPASPGATG